MIRDPPTLDKQGMTDIRPDDAREPVRAPAQQA
jgi:hypothetical protein